MNEIKLSGDMDIMTKNSVLKGMLEEENVELEKVHLWIENVNEDDNDLLAEHGFLPYRDLWKLNCALPLNVDRLEKAKELNIRPFTDADTENFLRIQNKAFEWHPDEANMDETELNRRFKQSWYDPADFLLLTKEPNGSELMGFCWTKIHKNTKPPAGEIYMIGIDPEYQGRSLGELSLRRGFEHLAKKGLTVGILYVESDNDPANAIYKKLGMELESINRAYRYTKIL